MDQQTWTQRSKSPFINHVIHFFFSHYAKGEAVHSVIHTQASELGLIPPTPPVVFANCVPSRIESIVTQVRERQAFLHVSVLSLLLSRPMVLLLV
jgi:hypothetical protein